MPNIVPLITCPRCGNDLQLGSHDVREPYCTPNIAGSVFSSVHDRLADVENKLDQQKEMLDRIFRVLDAAFSRFGDVLKSPMLQSLFAGLAPKPEKISVDAKSKKNR